MSTATIVQDAKVKKVEVFKETSKQKADQIILRETPDDLCQGGSSFPDQLVGRYVERSIHRATVERMQDGRYFAAIPVLRDVWADGDSADAALDALHNVTTQWVMMHIEDKTGALPIVDGIDLTRV